MNIIQITSFYPPHLGGQENIARETSERLAKKGHQIEVLTSDIDCPKDKQLKSNKNIKIHYLPAKEFAHTPIIFSLYKELMKIPQDSIMHVHVAQAYVPEIVYKIWKKRNIPYIAHILIDAEPSNFFGKIILKPYKKIFLKRFLRHAKKVIVLTEDYKDLMIKKYSIDRNRIEVIPGGVSNEFFTNRRSKNKVPRLLSVGRVSIQKNPLKLIKSVALCKSKFILDIVGDGDLLDETKKLVKEEHLGNVIFHGRKTGRDLIKMYENADLFISTTDQESFGLTYIEAMASGLPIITSNIPAVRNVVKNDYTGLLVDESPKDFAEAVEKLIKTSKLRERLARNGLKEAKKYSWDKIVEQTEKVYKEVLKEHNKKLNNKK